jgi:alkylation response protein AidB-like acyl-CoA dehydrogenase
MPSYSPPLKDFGFVLHDTLNVHENKDIPQYEMLQRDLTAAVLTEAGKIASEVLQPINRIGDEQGCILENGVVRTPEGFKEAFNAVRDGGWPGLECAEEFGGQGMPTVLSIAVGEMHSAANMAFAMYHGLTHGAYSAIEKHGTDAQKNLYLPKLASGEWAGTMNLTEPQCGTDLGLIRSKAEPLPDGGYAITGTKIFISSGEHDLSENIVHLVLAKIPGGPEGVKGISLFVVPKFLPGDNGALGPRNPLQCGRLEKKMGIHGNATCEMHFNGATGWLIGEKHKGLRAMFTMMNEARIGVGMQGLAQAEAAYQAAAAYARDRLQGRAATGDVAPEKPADPLIVHPDIRRSLMDQRAIIEGGRALVLWGATLIDGELRASDEACRKSDADMIALLTPVIKAFLTDKGFECTIQAQQVFGGHGYIEEHGMSQFARDARIAMIYEGANGVQALDLVGRKLPMSGGKPMMGFMQEVIAFVKQNKDKEGDEEGLTADFMDPLKAASRDLEAACMFFMQSGMQNPNAALAGATDFLHLFGHVAMGYMWARMAKAAQTALAKSASDTVFYNNKLITGRYYMKRLLPETGIRLARIQSGAEPVMALEADAF